MGELAEDFAFIKEQRKIEREAKEPQRVDYAIEQLTKAGHRAVRVTPHSGLVKVNGYIDLWAYKGWWSGKGIGSGRGIHNLIKKLEQSR